MPSKGYGSAQKFMEILEEEAKIDDSNLTLRAASTASASTHKEPHMLFENPKDASEWVEAQLGLDHIKSLERKIKFPGPMRALL